MSSQPAPSSNAIPFGVATLGITSFSVMDAVMKHLALALGAYNAMFWRILAAALLAGLLYFALRSPWPTRAAMRVHLTRGIMTSVMGFLFFWGLARVPLAQGVALSFVAPLIALYLAAVLLDERIERRAVLASLLGFAGVLVIFAAQVREQMGPDAFRGAMAVLAATILYAWNIILMRQQSQVARPVEIAFFSSLIISACYLPLAPALATLPPTGEIVPIAAAAALGVGSLILLGWAYRRAQAQHLVPVEYTAFIWAALLGFVFFAEPVRPLTLAGAAMIVVACFIAARRRPAPLANLETAI